MEEATDMPREKFLQQIADYYIASGADMSALTMVFPNRRSAMFLRKYLTGRMSTPAFLPRMVSITYFTQKLTDVALADNTELVFVLYNAYCTVLRRHKRGEQIPDFDNFYFWGSIVLRDFNDVDSYMVDAHQIYSNLKGLKEISADYLTEEQTEVARQLWGGAFRKDNVERFWMHVPRKGKEDAPSSRFLNLWEIMEELYIEFRRQLGERQIPIAYSGLQSRMACERVMKMGAGDFRGRRYAFIGFNVLSTSRFRIFQRLKQLGLAEFFWDTASPLVNGSIPAPVNAGTMIMPLSKAFPPPADFELRPIDTLPEIEIIAVPSNVGQTKVAAEILERWHPVGGNGDNDPELVNTAVVMADESLLTHMLYSIPAGISTINVTMGVPYTSTPFATLMSSIISMHLRVTLIRGAAHYFYQDIIGIVSHPHITLIAPESSALIKDKILRDHIYNINASELTDTYPDLAFIFRPLTNQRNISDVKDYISNLVDTMLNKLNGIAVTGTAQTYETRILEAYAEAIRNLCALVEQYGIALQERTFLQIIERTMQKSPLSFAGKPLKGLQIMGMGETRNLDFDNLLVLSMNERIYPRRNYTPSIIPPNLRAGYMLPTQETEESSMAYQFFRLISRARKVKLIYDSRTGGVTSGEKSRYLTQLQHTRGADVRFTAIDYKATLGDATVISVEKTPGVMAELRRFLPGGDLKLSATALKEYLGCPLRFYLKYVKGLRINEEVLQYIDAASYGTVIHHMAQELYAPYAGTRINAGILKKMAQSHLDERALRVLNDIYYKGRYTGHLDDIPGEGQIIARLIAKYLESMFASEEKGGDFVFIGAEVGERVKEEWKISDQLTVNFTMSVDRIDDIATPAWPDGRLRFIDYKTGSDSLEAKNIDEIFSNSHCGGIFQLLVYSHAYADIHGYRGGIKPLIYKFQTMPKEGINDLKVGGEPLEDYRQLDGGDDSFIARLRGLIENIFDPDSDLAFSQCEDDSHCLYCSFKQLCNRYPDTDNN